MGEKLLVKERKSHHDGGRIQEGSESTPTTFLRSTTLLADPEMQKIKRGNASLSSVMIP